MESFPHFQQKGLFLGLFLFWGDSFYFFTVELEYGSDGLLLSEGIVDDDVTLS